MDSRCSRVVPGPQGPGRVFEQQLSVFLPIRQLHVIEPGLVSFVVPFEVHLEGHVQFMHAGLLGRVRAVYIVLYTIQGKGDEFDVTATARELPSQVVPLIGRRRLAGDTGGLPATSRIGPDVPVAAGDIALCAKDPSLAAVGLIGVKLKGLRVLWRREVEIQVVSEVGGAACAELLPPQTVGIGRAAGQGEHSGIAAKGWALYTGCSVKSRTRPISISAGTSVATLPAGHSLNLRLDCLRGRTKRSCRQYEQRDCENGQVLGCVFYHHYFAPGDLFFAASFSTTKLTLSVHLLRFNRFRSLRGEAGNCGLSK
jgi:hypothetical protein